MDETKTRPSWVVELSVMEVLTLLALLVLVVGGLGLGAGFYLGTYQKNAQLNSIIGISQDLSESHKNERAAIDANYRMVLKELEKYETFLVGIEKARDGAKGSARGGQ